nr:hypothetical protein GCM10020093_059210 [Planobispora longispora]
MKRGSVNVDIASGGDVGGTIMTPPRRRRRVPGALAWAAVAPFAIWAVARVAGLERGSLPTQIMTATPYAAVGSLVPVLVGALARNRAATAVALVTTAALSLSVLPGPSARPRPDPAPRCAFSPSTCCTAAPSRPPSWTCSNA